MRRWICGERGGVCAETGRKPGRLASGPGCGPGVIDGSLISVGDGSGGVLVLVLIQLPDREWTTGIVQPCAGDAGRKFAIVSPWPRGGAGARREGRESASRGRRDGAAAQTGSGGDLAPEIPAFIGIVGDGADLVDDGGFTLDVRLVSDRAATVIALGNADVERGVSQAVSASAVRAHRTRRCGRKSGAAAWGN